MKCECGQLCRIRKYRRAGKPEREQAICAKTKKNEKCKYRQWVDIAHIRCHCGKNANLVKAGGLLNPENKGREYFRCPEKTGKDKRGCGYFKWKESLEFMLSKDWGKVYMTIDEALKFILERCTLFT